MKRPEPGNDGVYDFDTLVHEPRLARVGGEVVDVSVIPVGVSLAMAKFADRTSEEIEQAAEKDAEGELRRVLQMVSNVCLPSNPKFTVDFLMKHLDYEKLVLFNNFVLHPIEEPDEGNPKATE